MTITLTDRPEVVDQATRGIWDVAPDRMAAKWREFRGWPPPMQAMQMPISPMELMPGRTWPPSRFWPRNERLEMWRRVMEGDLTDFIGVLAPKTAVTQFDTSWHRVGDEGDVSGAPLVINYARRYVDLVSSLMLTVAPPDHLADPIQQSIHYTMRDGKSYVIRRGTRVEAVEAMWCFETSNMWTPQAEAEETTLYVVRPYISPMATWSLPDMVEICAIGGGVAVTWHARWSQVWGFGGIGAVMTQPVAAEGVWASIHNPPATFGWGQPAIQDLVPPMAGIALRLTGADRVLAAHEAPTLLVPIPNADIGSLLAVDIDKFREQGIGREVAVDIVKRLRDNNVAWAPDGVGEAKYLTWDGSLPDTWEMIDHLLAAIRHITGIPAAMEQEGGDIPSGTALNQMMLFLWAQTKQLHRQVLSAYQMAAGFFPWGNAFETAFAQAAAGEVGGVGTMSRVGGEGFAASPSPLASANGNGMAAIGAGNG